MEEELTAEGAEAVKGLVSEFAKALSDADSDIQVHAALALAKILGEALGNFNDFGHAMKEAVFVAVSALAKALGAADANTHVVSVAVSALAEALIFADYHVKVEAAVALGQFAGKALGNFEHLASGAMKEAVSTAVFALARALSDADSNIQVAAALALGNTMQAASGNFDDLGTAATKAVAALMRAVAFGDLGKTAHGGFGDLGKTALLALGERQAASLKKLGKLV